MKMTGSRARVLWGADSKSPWARRIRDLGGALGLDIGGLGKQLGYCNGAAVLRVLKGGRPSVDFLLRLQKSEAVYEREIKEFIRQARPFKRNRERYLAYGSPQVQRPPDIAEVGLLEALGTPSPASIRADAKRARAKAKALIWQRRFNEKNRKAKARRSATFRRRLYNLAFGTKRIGGQHVKDDFQKKEETDGN